MEQEPEEEQEKIRYIRRSSGRRRIERRPLERRGTGREEEGAKGTVGRGEEEE